MEMFKQVFLPVNIKQFDEGITLDAIKKFFAENKDNPDVKAYLGELSTPTVEGVKGFLETEEGKKLIQPKLDAHFTKSLETWKANNLQKIVDDEIRKRNPQKTPEQIELEKLRKEIEDERRARNREALVNKALKIADEKSLPKDVIDFFVGEDEETTVTNLSKLEEAFNAAVTKAVEAKFKANGRDPEPGNSGSGANAIDIGAIASEVSLTK
jgi:Domain of unknown function (DUF4355)